MNEICDMDKGIFVVVLCHIEKQDLKEEAMEKNCLNRCRKLVKKVERLSEDPRMVQLFINCLPILWILR